jgi:hypothetical protein
VPGFLLRGPNIPTINLLGSNLASPRVHLPRLVRPGTLFCLGEEIGRECRAALSVGREADGTGARLATFVGGGS